MVAHGHLVSGPQCPALCPSSWPEQDQAPLELVALREWYWWHCGKWCQHEDALVAMALLEAHRAPPSSGGAMGSSQILTACSGVNIARLAGGRAL